MNAPERDEIDDPVVRTLLSSPAVWAEPEPSGHDREDAVVRAIAAERAATPTPATATPATPTPATRATPGSTGLPSWRSPRRLLAAAAIVVVVTGAATIGMATLRSDPGTTGVAVALSSPDPASATRASATVDHTEKGMRIVLDASELPPAAPGSYYQAWIMSDEYRVSAGTFHLRGGDGRIVLWCGVDDPSYATLAVTLEVIDDGAPAGGYGDGGYGDDYGATEIPTDAEFVLVGRIGD